MPNSDRAKTVSTPNFCLGVEFQHKSRPVIAWIVLAVGLIITAAAALYVKASVEKTSEYNFVERCDTIRDIVANRLDDHARILLSGAAFFEASDRVTRNEWRIFNQEQKVQKHLPGIQGTGFALLIPRAELTRHLEQIRSEGFPDYSIRPEGERDLYSSIIYLEPFSGRNLRAFGYDMLPEPVRRKAMETARDTDSAALSGKVTLVQETDVEVQAGALMYVPVYRKGMPVNSVQERREAIYGWVYSAYRMNDLMRGILGSRFLTKSSGLSLRLFDGGETSSQNLLYEYVPAEHATLRGRTRFTRQTSIDFNGHYWTLCFTQTGGGPGAAEYLKVWLAVVGGAVIALLLFILIRTLLSARAKAWRIAQSLTENLRESELRHRRLVENSHDIIYTVAVDGICTFVSPSWTALLGDPVNEVVGRPFRQFIHPDDFARYEDFVQRVINDGPRQAGVEYRVRSVDGTWRWHISNAARLTDETGAAIGFEGTARDITERKRDEDQLRQTRRNYETFFNTIDDFLFVLDPQGNITHANNKVFDSLGYTKEDLFGAPFVSVHPPERREEADAIIHDMLTGAAEVCPIPIITKSGVPVPVETRVSHGFWDGSAAIFGVSKDLSKIKLSEEKFSKAFHMNPVSMALLRCEDGIIIDVNKTFLRVFDYSREEVIGQTLSHLNFFVDLADQKVASKTIKCNEIIRETEVTVKAKNGSQRVGLFSTETVYIGKDLCLLTVFVDMSQQKESENALREKTALLGNLLASIPDIIFFKNIHGVYLGCNPEFARFVGREPSMIAGFTDFDLFGREVADSFREQDQIMMGQGVPRHNEEWVAFPDGPRKLLDTFKAPLRDADGRIIGLLGISRDITERDCSQKALAEKEEKIRLLLDSTAEAIYGLDLDGNCTFCNNSCLGLLGYKDPKELLGKNMHLQIHAKHADGTAFPVEKCRIFQAFRKGDATHVDNEVLWRADGTCFYAEYWSYPQREAGAVVGAVVTFLDITERRQAEAEAQKAFRVKSDFISMVSHELRTPLSVIVEGIKLVVDGSCGSLNNEQKEYLTIAERNVDRLGRLINDVLDIQKLESGLMKYRLGEYDINELIAALMVSMGTLAKKRGLELEYAAGTDIPKITFDSDKIAQVMTNLISNALKFTEQGKVTVKTECRDGRVKVSVSDTGTGIREQDMHRLFGKFEQIITGNERKTGGTGLGLSISREIIKSHGGEIWAESEFGVGTTFSFTLPISPRSPASA